VWSPSFKLESQGQGRLEEIKSMQYDQINYRLLVLTDNFISNFLIYRRHLEYNDWIIVEKNQTLT